MDTVFTCKMVICCRKASGKVRKVIKDRLHCTAIPVRDKSSRPTGRGTVLVMSTVQRVKFGKRSKQTI